MARQVRAFDRPVPADPRSAGQGLGAGAGRSSTIWVAAAVGLGVAALVGALVGVVGGPVGWLVLAALGGGVGGLAHCAVGAERRAAGLRDELASTWNRAELDDLTGLAGRERVAADIERRLAERRPTEVVGVLTFALGRLGMVNDALGHAAGDEVLIEAARRLTGVVRRVDLVGRLGGDEFVVVTSGLPALRDLEILSGRLVEALARPIALADGSSPIVSGAVGIAAAAGRAGVTVTAADLLRDAGAALHRAERQGVGRPVMFDESLRIEAMAHLDLEQELRDALRHDQLAVHYQPLVDAAAGRIDEVEALVRWNHPERGTVLPSQFLPVAATSPLILEIGVWVLAEACRQAAAWSARLGRPIAVAVNLAERQLTDRRLVEIVEQALSSADLAAHQLTLEISEGLLDRCRPQLGAVLPRLDLLGVRMAVDDFGTSQGSPGRLGDLTGVSTVKIDRLLVADIASDDIDRRIVAAIVERASRLGLAVVAEGVERPEQAGALVELGVQRLQGFLFGRPAPACALDGVLRDARRADQLWSAPGVSG